MVTDIIDMAGKILKINYFGFDSLAKFFKIDIKMNNNNSTGKRNNIIYIHLTPPPF